MEKWIVLCILIIASLYLAWHIRHSIKKDGCAGGCAACPAGQRGDRAGDCNNRDSR